VICLSSACRRNKSSHQYTDAVRDLIRLRISAPEAVSGELPLAYARRALTSVQELLAAGARSAYSPIASFSRATTVRVVDRVLDNLTLGQTQAGSFVVQVYSPIAGDWQISALTDRDTPEKDIPFERQAVMRLADGAAAAKQIAELGAVDLEDRPELERGGRNRSQRQPLSGACSAPDRGGQSIH